jgi:hypothetical protein
VIDGTTSETNKKTVHGITFVYLTMPPPGLPLLGR